MDRLYAPWRMSYVEQPQKPDSPDPAECIFCNIAAQDEDIENHVIHRGECALVLLNRFPYNNGHVLIAPYLHTASLDNLTAAISQEIFAMTRQAQRALELVFRPQGYNLGMNLGAAAGAGITDHLHLHIVPRWNGDTNFMPALADVKVLPDSLRHSAALLREVWV